MILILWIVQFLIHYAKWRKRGIQKNTDLNMTIDLSHIKGMIAKNMGKHL